MTSCTILHNTRRKNKLMADLQANSQNPEIAQTQTDRESSDDCVTHKEKGRTNSEDTGSSLA